jgi:pimeloyl-ACP methyl ester carboxylesterase
MRSSKKSCRGPDFALPDEDADIVFGGPVSVITGRQDGIVGYADQFHSMRHYPRGTFAVIDAAGHYLPFEQPALLRSLTQDWLHRTRS